MGDTLTRMAAVGFMMTCILFLLIVGKVIKTEDFNVDTVKQTVTVLIEPLKETEQSGGKWKEWFSSK